MQAINDLPKFKRPCTAKSGRALFFHHHSRIYLQVKSHAAPAQLPILAQAILNPAVRRFPADDVLRETNAEKLIPPLVPQLRKRVKERRDSGYAGATDTSKSPRTNPRFICLAQGRGWDIGRDR